VESTLGISVVSLLANKHGIGVTLSAGNPGLTVDISLPSTLFGPIDAPTAQPVDASAAHVMMAPAGETIVAWNDDDPTGLAGLTIDEAFQPVGHAEPAPAAVEQSTSPAGIDDEQPVTSSDWTKMSLNLSAFQTGQQSATQTPAEPDAEPIEQFEPAAEYEPAAPVDEPVAAQLEPAAAVAEPDFESIAPPSLTELAELVSDETFAPAEHDQLVPASPDLPPPPMNLRGPGEFDSPLAPPMTASGPSRGPVAPETARSAAARSAPDAGAAKPNLPTRSPGSGPDGPDRLIDIAPDNEHAPSDPGAAPSALQSALSAFDSGRNGTNGSNGSLPTRTPVGEPVDQIEEPLATAPSRLDPDALRDRLRAFQTEFRSGGGGDDGDDDVPGSTAPGTNNDHNSDLGGDLR
jgi:hypothetical protein